MSAAFGLRFALFLLIATGMYGSTVFAQPEDAITRYTKEVQANPNSAAAYLNRCGAYSAQKRYADAMQDCNQAVTLAPNLWSAYYNRGSLYLLMKDRPNAAKDFTATINLKNDIAGAFFFRGRILQDDKKYDLAVADFSRIIALGFGSLNVKGVSLSDIYFNRGLCYNALENFKAAAEDMSQTMGLDPGFENAYYYLGVAQLKQGKDAEAFKAFDSFVKFHPNEWLPIASRAMASINLKEYDSAVSDLSNAIALNPTEPRLFRLRANAYKGSGDKKLAEKDEKTAEGMEKQLQAKR